MRIAPAITLGPEQRTFVGVPSSESISPGEGGGACPHRTVGGFRATRTRKVAAVMAVTPKKFPAGASVSWRWAWQGCRKTRPGPDAKPTIGTRLTKRVVTMTTRQQPANATHWSTRTMAAVAVGISEASVRRIWHAHGLKPHRVDAFKISNDPAFAEKLEDIVGLYLDPPEHALVLCADEKSQIQALDRTQPRLAAEAWTRCYADARL